MGMENVPDRRSYALNLEKQAHASGQGSPFLMRLAYLQSGVKLRVSGSSQLRSSSSSPPHDWVENRVCRVRQQLGLDMS